jgi:hypothetical protein
MKTKRKGEMSRLIWSFTIPVLLLVAIIVGFYLIEGIISVNNSAKNTKQLIIKQTVQSYTRMGENFQKMNFNPDLAKALNPEIFQALSRGDLGPIYNLIMNISGLASPAEYIGLIKDGKVYDYTVKPGVTIDQKQILTSPPTGNYKTLDSFGNVKGTLIYVFYPIDLSKVGLGTKIYMSSVFDLTKQVKEIDSYFNNQKNDTVVKLIMTGLIALILFALLSIFWLRYLIDKYIRKPVENLNTMAEEIAAGTFEGEVVVDQSSDFAALQGLLKSGQLVLRKHDEKMDDEG